MVLTNYLTGDGDDVHVNTSIFKGFVWVNMSCSYDSVFTTLWMVYSTCGDQIKKAFNDNLPFMGEMFTQMKNNTISAEEANNNIRDYYYKPTLKNSYARGMYQSVQEIINHLLSQCIIPLYEEGQLDVFDIKTVCHKNCLLDSCELVSDLESDKCINLSNSTNFTLRMTDMIEEHFKLQLVSYYCVNCRFQIDLSYELVGCPMIAFICFTGAFVGRNLDIDINIGIVGYTLLSALYLVGGSHFICRFNIDGMTYAYDGMVRKGVFQKVTINPPFPGTTYDADGTVLMSVQAVYYRRNEL